MVLKDACIYYGRFDELIEEFNGKAHFVTTQTCDMYLKGGSWGVGGCSPKCKFYKCL